MGAGQAGIIAPPIPAVSSHTHHERRATGSARTRVAAAQRGERLERGGRMDDEKPAASSIGYVSKHVVRPGDAADHDHAARRCGGDIHDLNRIR